MKKFPIRVMTGLAHMGALSLGEAACTVRALRRGDDYACEAVAHYGGASRLLRDVATSYKRQNWRRALGADFIARCHAASARHMDTVALAARGPSAGLDCSPYVARAAERALAQGAAPAH